MWFRVDFLIMFALQDLAAKLRFPEAMIRSQFFAWKLPCKARVPFVSPVASPVILLGFVAPCLRPPRSFVSNTRSPVTLLDIVQKTSLVDAPASVCLVHGPCFCCWSNLDHPCPCRHWGERVVYYARVCCPFHPCYVPFPGFFADGQPIPVKSKRCVTFTLSRMRFQILVEPRS